MVVLAHPLVVDHDGAVAENLDASGVAGGYPQRLPPHGGVRTPHHDGGGAGFGNAWHGRTI